MSDIQFGQQFYEEQQEGLGAYFLDSLFSDIDALLLYAGIHPQFFGYYRALSKRFPFAIYYRVSGQTIQVWRVLDCRQKPSRVVNALRT
ncbi:MAG: type II toxin-antitoxin system RelE/ParE family toxin [Sulfuricellaceae bacterium]|nr:type II toxin-antitoxin system RelE/ParE family toxin [Sulfuricellaceae bacterium]